MNVPPRRVYLLCPLERQERYRKAVADAVENLRSRGFEVESSYSPDGPASATLKGAIQQAVTACLDVDMVVLLPGWWYSSQVAISVALLAVSIGVPVCTSDDALEPRATERPLVKLSAVALARQLSALQALDAVRSFSWTA